MDLYRYLKELHEEKKRLDKVIQSLEEMVYQKQSSLAGNAKRRGRKPGMTDEEKKRISERMQRFWAQRREERAKGMAGGSTS